MSSKDEDDTSGTPDADFILSLHADQYQERVISALDLLWHVANQVALDMEVDVEIRIRKGSIGVSMPISNKVKREILEQGAALADEPRRSAFIKLAQRLKNQRSR